MCCTSRPSIDRTEQPQGSQPMRSRPMPAMWEALGPSGPLRAGHKDICRAGHIGRFQEPGPTGARTRHGNRARASPSSALGPSVRALASRVVQAQARRQHPIRGESSQKVPGHLSFDFESEDWRGLWDELKSVIDFWIAQGIAFPASTIRIPRAFAFWEWVIGEIKG